ncbi:MAG: hypothetical protein R6V50_02250 [Thermoplasmatota archaeon]
MASFNITKHLIFVMVLAIGFLFISAVASGASWKTGQSFNGEIKTPHWQIGQEFENNIHVKGWIVGQYFNGNINSYTVDPDPEPEWKIAQSFDASINTGDEITIGSGPTKDEGLWITPIYAYDSDHRYSYTTHNERSHVWYGFGFDIPYYLNETNVLLRVDAANALFANTYDIEIRVSGNGGLSWSEPFELNVTNSRVSYWLNISESFEWNGLMLSGDNLRVKATSIDRDTGQLRIYFISMLIAYTTDPNWQEVQTFENQVIIERWAIAQEFTNNINSFIAYAGSPMGYGIKTISDGPTFYDKNRHWIFYINGTNTLVFISSTNGVVFSSEIGIADATQYGIYYDGEQVHLAWYYGGNISYRCGIPQTDGSVSWVEGIQQVVANVEWYTTNPTVSVDSEGYPFIFYANGTSSENTDLILIHSSTNDGTWLTASSTIIEENGKGHTINSALISMGNRNMLAVWESPGVSPNPIRSTHYTYGTGWGAVTYISHDSFDYYMTARGYGGIAHVIYIDDEINLNNIHKIYNTTTNSWTTINDSVVNITYSTFGIGGSTGNLYLLYPNSPDFNFVYMKIWTPSTGWGNPFLIDEYGNSIDVMISTKIIYGDPYGSIFGYVLQFYNGEDILTFYHGISTGEYVGLWRDAQRININGLSEPISWRMGQIADQKISSQDPASPMWSFNAIIWILMLFLPAILLGFYLGKVGLIGGLIIMSLVMWLGVIIPLWLFLIIVIGTIIIMIRGGG